MRISNKGLVELVGHEGVCLTKYKDSVGVWTIGIGATRTEIPDIDAWPLDKKITIQEAFNLLKKGVRKYEDELNKHINVEIPQHQFDALVSWCYNVGTGWVKKASVIKHINHLASKSQLYDALMMFNKPKEIIGRRRKEAELIRDGKYSNEGKALLFPVSSKGYPIYSKGTTINVWEYIDKSSESVPVIPKAEEKSLVNMVIDFFKGGK